MSGKLQIILLFQPELGLHQEIELKNVMMMKRESYFHGNDSWRSTKKNCRLCFLMVFLILFYLILKADIAIKQFILYF